MINIRDHGALPDPAKDNTQSISAALDAAKVSTETRTVVIPPGVFNTRQIVVPAGVTLTGDGGTLKHMAVTINGESCIDIRGADATISNLTIDGNWTAQTLMAHGILVQGDRSQIDNVKVMQVSGTGVFVSGRSGHRLEKIRVSDAGQNGIGFTAPTSGVVARDFTIYAAQIERTNDGGIGVMGENFSVIGCTTRDTGGDGITAYADDNAYYTLEGNNMTGVANNGIHSAGSGATIIGNTIKDCVHRGIYHLAKAILVQEGVAISSNVVRNTGLDGYEIWPVRGLAMIGNTMIGGKTNAFNVRRADGVTLIGNVADAIGGNAYLLSGVKNLAGAGNVGTNIVGDLVKIDDNTNDPSLNAAIFGTVGNMVNRAMSISDKAGWIAEFGSMPGTTGPAPYSMGSATNRRIMA